MGMVNPYTCYSLTNYGEHIGVLLLIIYGWINFFVHLHEGSYNYFLNKLGELLELLAECIEIIYDLPWHCISFFIQWTISSEAYDLSILSYERSETNR